MSFFAASPPAPTMAEFASHNSPAAGTDSASSQPSFWETAPATTSALAPTSAAMAAAAADVFRATYAPHDPFATPSKASATSDRQGNGTPAEVQLKDGFPVACPLACGVTLLSLPMATEHLKLHYQRAPLAPLASNLAGYQQGMQPALHPSARAADAAETASFFSSPWGEYFYEPAYLGAQATTPSLPSAAPQRAFPSTTLFSASSSEQTDQGPDPHLHDRQASLALDRADPASPSETGPTRRARRPSGRGTLDAASGGSGGRSRAKGRFSCQFCGTVVSRMDSLTRHMKRKHPQQVTAAGGNIGFGPVGIPVLTPSRSSSVSTASSPGGGLVCSLCHVQLSRIDSLLRHLKKQHGQDPSASSPSLA